MADAKVLSKAKQDEENFAKLKDLIGLPCACSACTHIDRNNLIDYINQDPQRRIDLLMWAAQRRNLSMLKVLLASDPRVEGTCKVEEHFKFS